MLQEHFTLILITAAAMAMAFRLAMGSNPSSRTFRLLERAASAAALLYLWNLLLPADASLGINPLTLTLTACLGSPGLAAMAAVKLLR